jgi:hypothetical protein
MSGVLAAIVASIPLCALEATLLSDAHFGLWRSGPTLVAMNAMLLSLVFVAPSLSEQHRRPSVLRLQPIIGGLTWTALALLSRELTVFVQGIVH